MDNLEKIAKSEEICLNFGFSRSQRLKEMQDFGNDNGCEGYKTMGCYSCDGHKTGCEKYNSSNHYKKKKIK